MLLTSSTLPKPALFAGPRTPVSRAVMEPAVFVRGLGHVLITKRECRNSVGLPFCGLPLNARTHPGIVAPAVLVACAFPVPTRELPHSAIACFSFVFARDLLQTGTEPGLNLKSLSK